MEAEERHQACLRQLSAERSDSGMGLCAARCQHHYKKQVGPCQKVRVPTAEPSSTQDLRSRATAETRLQSGKCHSSDLNDRKLSSVTLAQACGQSWLRGYARSSGVPRQPGSKQPMATLAPPSRVPEGLWSPAPSSWFRGACVGLRVGPHSDPRHSACTPASEG